MLLLAAAVGFAAWLPFLHAPLTADESGFLLLAQHWSPGTSLYGDYWVDRPPLLLGLFSLAGHLTPTGALETAPALKLMAATASGVSVLLAGVLGGLVEDLPGLHRARRLLRPRVVAPLVALVFLASPFFGLPEVDGEVLAVPFVLLGLVLLVAALQDPRGRRGLAWAAGAGGAAMAAALVKQNEIDVFVLAGALLLTRRGRAAGLAGRAVAFAGGALAVLGVTLAGAAARGTSPGGIWDAVVVFRMEASAVIGMSSSEATPARMVHMAEVFVISGGAVLLVLAALVVLRDRSSLVTWPALCLVGWELVGVAMGGSYWWHYLTGMVPGLVLLAALAALAARVRLGAVVGAGLVYAVVINLLAWVHWTQLPSEVSPEEQAAAYLRTHAEASDGVVVAFGHPEIVAASGLSSPYSYLWSLPVRVRDPRLVGLQDLLAGPDAPRWVVVDGDSLDSWGLDASAAQEYLLTHYGVQRTYGEWHVWKREDGTTG